MDADFLNSFNQSRQSWSTAVTEWKEHNTDNLQKEKEQERKVKNKVRAKWKTKTAQDQGQQHQPKLEIPQINYDFTEKKHGGYSFGKLDQNKHTASTSTLATVKDIEQLQNPNIAVLKPNKPSYSFGKVTEPNEKLKLKRKVEEQLEKAQLDLEKCKANDPFKLTKQRVSGGYIAPKKQVSEKERIRIAMNKVGQNYSVKAGPGKYQASKEKIMNKAPSYTMREKTHKEKKVDLDEVKRAPGRYEGKEEILHPHVPEITIPKEKKEKEIELDMRKALDVKVELTKKRVPVAYFEPEHQPGETAIENEFMEMKLGPGKYQVSHKLTENRMDLGNVALREQSHPQVEKQDLRFPLFPNYDFDKPHKGNFVYHEPLGNLDPQHPQNVEPKGYLENHWKYYNINLDAVKEKGPIHDFASNLPQPQFKAKDIERKEWEIFKLRTQGVPGAGRYDPKKPESEPAVPDFSKMQGRETTEEIQRELGLEGIDGDVLHLNPDKLKPKIPSFKMEKMQGRQEIKDIELELGLDDQPSLDLKINYDFQKKKVPMLVNMQKQVGRREVWEGEEDTVEGDNVLLPSRSMMEASSRKKNTAYYDMKRMGERFKPSSQEYEIDGDNQLLNPEKKSWRENRGAKWGRENRFESLDIIQEQGLNDLAYTLKLTVNMEVTEPEARAHLFPKEKRFT